MVQHYPPSLFPPKLRYPLVPPFWSPPPDDLNLIDRIRSIDTLCTCDSHAPELYTLYPCSHGLLAGMTNVNEFFAMKPVQKAEALTLVRAAVDSFNVPLEMMSPMQQRAVARFNDLKLNKFGWQDGGKAMGREKVKRGVLRIFNELFFFGALNLDFKWKDLQGAFPGVAGHCHPDGLIELDLRFVGQVGPKEYDARITARLSTLLHEVIHAYLFQYACEGCPTFMVNVENADGHGRAFQILQHMLGKASERLLGMTLQSEGIDDYTSNWSGVRYWPSIHDLQIWGWIPEPEQPEKGGEAGVQRTSKRSTVKRWTPYRRLDEDSSTRSASQ